MITLEQGDLLAADAEALVNAVNTVGIMGKGIALQFKHAFPENFRTYAGACRSGEMRLGRVLVTETGAAANPRYIVNFPTKRHWRSRSRLEDVRSGLCDLRSVVVARRISSVAVPPLGCGQGGLAWADVQPLIEAAFADLDAVHAMVFPPGDGSR